MRHDSHLVAQNRLLVLRRLLLDQIGLVFVLLASPESKVAVLKGVLHGLLVPAVCLVDVRVDQLRQGSLRYQIGVLVAQRVLPTAYHSLLSVRLLGCTFLLSLLVSFVVVLVNHLCAGLLLLLVENGVVNGLPIRIQL